MSLRNLLITALAIYAILPSTGHANVADSLIKASGPSVYYVGQDQKRYAFPTEATYKTWYEDFSTVQTVSDQTLATYPLVGNVTYRPGTRLIKITTDPKVYAVARRGVLRWIQTETLARALYGDTWAQQIDDISDSFFINYRVGTPIASISDFNRAEERSAAFSISANQIPLPPPSPTLPPDPSSLPPVASSTPPVLPSPPTTSSSPFTISLQTSVPRPIYGQSFTLRAEATPANQVLRTKIYLDDILLRTCDYYICASDILIPITDTQPSHQARVEVDSTSGIMSSSTLQIQASGGSSYINLILRRPDVEPNGYRELIAQVSSEFLARDLDIYLDGGRIRSCGALQECRYSERETSTLGTVHSAFVVATDRNGVTARSETKTFTVVANDSPIIEVNPDKTSLYVNERMDVTVSASDDDGIQQTTISLDGSVIKTCAASTCTATIGPWTQPRIFHITGSATDLLGARSSASSTMITVRLP